MQDRHGSRSIFLNLDNKSILGQTMIQTAFDFREHFCRQVMKTLTECFKEFLVQLTCEESFGQFSQIHLQKSRHRMDVNVFQEMLCFVWICNRTKSVMSLEQNSDEGLLTVFEGFLQFLDIRVESRNTIDTLFF